jgi:hypothetical protein
MHMRLLAITKTPKFIQISGGLIQPHEVLVCPKRHHEQIFT